MQMQEMQGLLTDCAETGVLTSCYAGAELIGSESERANQTSIIKAPRLLRILKSLSTS